MCGIWLVPGAIFEPCLHIKHDNFSGDQIPLLCATVQVKVEFSYSVVHVEHVSLAGFDGAVLHALLDANLQFLLLSTAHGTQRHQGHRQQEKQPHV